MSLLETGMVALRDRKRLAEISGVLARFGVGGLLQRFGLSRFVTPTSAELDGPVAKKDMPERLRLALQELGPTFVKLGQILSTRTDLLPAEWIMALEALQSSVDPEPWEVVRSRIEADLGAPVGEVFATFDERALAAGSIAQVHMATLFDGTRVVVKARRDGLGRLVAADLRLLSHAAAVAEGQWPDLARYRPREVLDHLGKAMSEELDLTIEAQNGRLIAANLAEMKHVHIPRTYPEWSGERLLVQEFVDGIAPNDGTALANSGLDRSMLARRGAEAFLHMVLVDGVFHADPHPGNLRALPDNRIAFIDFGMVGHIADRRREQLLVLVQSIIDGDGPRIAGLLTEWAGGDGGDLNRLEAACDGFAGRHGQRQFKLGPAINELMGIARDYRLALPPDLALLFKALITADGVMRQLDPDFDVIAVARPIVMGQVSKRFGPAALAGKGKALAFELADLATDLPALLRLLTLRLRQGKIAAEIELRGLDRIGGDIRWAANRVGVAVVTAAFALGLAPRLFQYGPQIIGIPLAVWLGLAVIISGMAWLMLPRR